MLLNDDDRSKFTSQSSINRFLSRCDCKREKQIVDLGDGGNRAI